MVLKQKRSKVSRQRGSNSHSWGHKKKHRGSGHRGGFGLAGTGARGDSQKAGLLAGGTGILKKISASRGVRVKDLKKTLSRKAWFGKRGFTSIHKKKQNVLSLRFIEENFDNLVEKGAIIKEKNDFIFDTTQFKYDKVLGKTKISKKIKLICNEISQTAKTRIEEAGGSVEVLNQSEDDFVEETSDKKEE